MRGHFFRFTYLFILIAIAQCFIGNVEAQPPAQQLIDSLQNALSKRQPENQRVKLLTKLSETIFGTKPDEGRLLGLEAIELSKKAKLPREEAEARVALAACLWGLGQHLQAIDQYGLAMPIAEQFGNRRLQARIQHGIAINYGAIDKKEMAIAYLKKSLDIQLRDRNDSGAMGCYHNLAQYSDEIGNKKAAYQYYKQALTYAQRAKHDRGIAYTYMRLGSQESKLGNESQGILFIKEALKRFQAMGDISGMAECWAVQAQVNHHWKRNAETISCYLQAIRLQRQVNGQYFRRVLSGYLMDLADALQQAPQTQKTFINIRDAWKESLSIARTTEDWQAGARSAQALSQLYRNIQEPTLALDYYQEYIQHRDKFLNIEKEKEKNRYELQTQYNDSIAVMKKLQDKQLTIVRQESALREASIMQSRLYALVGVALLALLLSFLLYRNRLQKLRFRSEMQQSQKDLEQKAAALQKQIREATLSALQAQMNPHFIFNSLNVIQSFVYSGEKELASHLIGKFSELLRQTLHFSRNSLISLEEELSFIRAYTELEVNRMPPDLTIQYEIASDIKLSRVLLPPLLIQPFVENALRHGLYHKEGSRRLRISVEGTTESVSVEIDDNGVGRKAAKLFSSQADHLAFSSGANAERIALLNQVNDVYIHLQIIDKTTANGDSEGTTVKININSQHTQ